KRWPSHLLNPLHQLDYRVFTFTRVAPRIMGVNRQRVADVYGNIGLKRCCSLSWPLQRHFLGQKSSLPGNGESGRAHQSNRVPAGMLSLKTNRVPFWETTATIHQLFQKKGV